MAVNPMDWLLREWIATFVVVGLLYWWLMRVVKVRLLIRRQRQPNWQQRAQVNDDPRVGFDVITDRTDQD